MPTRRSKNFKPAAMPAAQAGSGKAVGDSFTNMQVRLGYGAGSQQDGAGFSQNYISRNRLQLEAAYRTNWVCGMAVDCVADDMTREGIEIASTMPPEDIEKLNSSMDKLRVWDALRDCVAWARLYGGSIAVMLIDGQKLDTPLRMETVGKGQFKGLLVLDRWVAQASVSEYIKDYGPDMGKPKWYDVTGDGQALRGMRIHHSRVIRMEGLTLPYYQRLAENGWGQSVLERVWDRIVAFDSTTAGAAQLVYKAHLRTYKVQGLRDIIATGGKAFEGLIKQIEMIRQYQSNEGMTLMDSNDEFEANTYTFAGLGDMLLQFGQQLSGALQIPLVRLFGQSPAGLNSTGDSDVRTYYDNVAKAQETQLRPGVGKVLEVVHRSEFGTEPPKGFGFEFRSLWQMPDTEKATVALNVAQAVTAAEEAGIIDRATALKELRQSSHTTGVFSNITDEQIAEAEAEPPPAPDQPEDPNAAPPGEQGSGSKPVPGRKEDGKQAGSDAQG